MQIEVGGRHGSEGARENPGPMSDHDTRPAAADTASRAHSATVDLSQPAAPQTTAEGPALARRSAPGAAVARASVPPAVIRRVAGGAGNRAAAQAVRARAGADSSAEPRGLDGRTADARGDAIHRRTDDEANARADSGGSGGGSGSGGSSSSSAGGTGSGGAPGQPAASSSDRDLFDQGIRDRDPAPLKSIGSWGGFNEAEKMQALNILHNQGWAGPLDEAAMETIWGSFGESLPAVASRNIGVWEACIARGAELADLPAVARFRTTFETDVKALAKGYMARNLVAIEEEIGNLGAESTAGTADQQRDRDERLQFIQDLMKEVDKAKEAADALKRIPVGYHVRQVKGGLEYHEVKTRALFDPAKAPEEGAGGTPGFADYAAVKGHWDRIQAVINAYAAMSPAVHTALRDGTTSQIANASPDEARTMISEGLRTTEVKIKETQPKIDTGDLDWRDLKPIHAQLFGGQGAPSGTNWGDRFYKSVAEDVIGDHEGMETLLAVGAGILAGALFVIAEIASGGLATFCLIGGVGVGVGQAARSWEQWEDLNTAAKASASPDTEIVTQGQADSALITAIVDTVFAFIDMFPMAKGVGRVWSERAMKAAVAEARGLEGLAKIARGAAGMTPEATSAALTRGVVEIGVPETLRRSGKTAEEVLAVVGRDSDAGKRILEYQRVLAGAGSAGVRGAQRTAGEQLAKIASGELTGDAAETAAREALSMLGPTETIKKAGGWTRLSSVLGNGSATGQQLTQWRRAMYDDLVRWAEAGGLDRAGLSEGEKVIEATGSSGSFKNDLDISTHGTKAAENRDAARRYLASRAGCGPTELFNVLKNDFFTSAARMHAYDQVVPEALRDSIRTRQAALQQQLVMNSQLQAAVKEGDNAMAAQLRAQMSAAGIPERPVTLLSKSEAETLSREVDGLQQQLIDACSAGDVAAQQRVANQIVERQAMVNVAEEGGYFTSGGTRRFVTERGAREAPGSTVAAMPASERLSAVIDQIPKLEHASQELHAARATGDLGELAEAIRSVGKYGQRMSEVGFAGPAPSEFASLAGEFAQLKKAADAGIETGDVAARVADAQRLLERVGTQSRSVLEMLRSEAGLAHDLVSMEAVSKAMQTHARYLQFQSRFRQALLRIPQSGVRVGTQGSMPRGGDGPTSGGEPPAP